MWVQRHLRLSPQARGFHLITREVVQPGFAAAA